MTPNQESVYKREDGLSGRSVQNDHDMHKAVLAAAIDNYWDGCHENDDDEKEDKNRIPVRIGSSYEIIEATDSEAWKGTDFGPCRTYRMERIPAMPEPVRQTLIHMYCPEGLRDTVSKNKDDEDCLIHLYLGRRQTQRQSESQRFSLRNYPLHVDQMEELGLNTHAMAEALADTLACCLWEARVDLDGVEFVLAPAKDALPPSIPLFKAFGDEYPIWMLDYDCCRNVSKNGAGIRQAVKAFYGNDYFPRPYADGYTDSDGQLWQTFRTRFLETSHRLLREYRCGPLTVCVGADCISSYWESIEGTDEDLKQLANYFIERVEAEGEIRRKFPPRPDTDPSTEFDFGQFLRSI